MQFSLQKIKMNKIILINYKFFTENNYYLHLIKIN